MRMPLTCRRGFAIGADRKSGDRRRLLRDGAPREASIHPRWRAPVEPIHVALDSGSRAEGAWTTPRRNRSPAGRTGAPAREGLGYGELAATQHQPRRVLARSAAADGRRGGARCVRFGAAKPPEPADRNVRTVVAASSATGAGREPRPRSLVARWTCRHPTGPGSTDDYSEFIEPPLDFRSARSGAVATRERRADHAEQAQQAEDRQALVVCTGTRSRAARLISRAEAPAPEHRPPQDMAKQQHATMP